MRSSRRSTSLLASLTLVAICTACATPVADMKREKCRMTFAQCAPPARFDDKTDLSKLTPRNLVQLSARLDISDKLARRTATRLKSVVMSGGMAELLEIESALEDTTAILGRCSCDEFKAELYAQEIPDLLKSRLPSKETRSPELWADRIFARLAAVRELRRASATLLAGGGGDAEKAGGGTDARRQLCIAVHGARAALPAPTFATALDIVSRKEVEQAGEGSAAAARQTLADIQAADTCGPEDSEQSDASP